MAGEALTQAEFARRVGVSRPRISQLVKVGQLPTVPGARRGQRFIPWLEGKAAWDIGHGVIPADESEAAPSRGPAPKPTPGRPSSNDIALKHAAARAADKAYQAETRRLKLEQLRGTLVSADGVRADAEACAVRVRSDLLGLPSRLAMSLEGRTAVEIETMLDAAIVEALTKLSEDAWASTPQHSKKDSGPGPV